MRRDRAAQAVTIFTALVALSVIVAFGAFVLHLVDAFSPPKAQATRTTLVAQNADIAPVIALAPFGRPSSDSAPPTSLALQLRGVMVAIPRERSTALIAPPGGAPAMYLIGQPVAGGGTIEEIAIDRVLLRVNGRLERLDLPRVSTATASPAPSGAGQPLPPPMATQVSPPPQPISPGAPPPRPIAALFENIPATPTQAGYRVGSPLSPHARQAGLQTGDLIEKVNGMAANDLSADRSQLAALLASGYAQIGVLRGERRLSLSFPFR